MPIQNLTRLAKEVGSSEGLGLRPRWVLFLLGRDRPLRHGVLVLDANPSSRTLSPPTLAPVFFCLGALPASRCLTFFFSLENDSMSMLSRCRWWCAGSRWLSSSLRFDPALSAGAIAVLRALKTRIAVSLHPLFTRLLATGCYPFFAQVLHV